MPPFAEVRCAHTQNTLHMHANLTSEVRITAAFINNIKKKNKLPLTLTKVRSSWLLGLHIQQVKGEKDYTQLVASTNFLLSETHIDT